MGSLSAAQADEPETAADIRKRKRLERDPLHQGLIVERTNLKQRDYQIDLAARLGKTQVHRAAGGLRLTWGTCTYTCPQTCCSSALTSRSQVVSLNMPLSQQAGYYCSVCDCILRDSASYLDHINGKYHNRALGMTMRVEKSTVDQVRARQDGCIEGTRMQWLLQHVLQACISHVRVVPAHRSRRSWKN
jgi:U4/U6.U5 tri-snRNP component SNU23